MKYRDEQWDLVACGCSYRALVRTPERIAPDPWMLVSLALDRRTTLDELPYSIVTGELLASGHYVASFDMPNHGELSNADGSGLAGMARALSRGADVFGLAAEMGSALEEAAVARGAARAGRFLACGTSRGALAALHLAARDPRIAATTVFSPVTMLAHLPEFAQALANAPYLVAASDAFALVQRLADRPLYMAISERDGRVGTDNVLRFHEMLAAASSRSLARLDVFAGEGHGLPTEAYRRGARFLLCFASPHAA